MIAKRSSAKDTPVISKEPTQEEIERRAYEIFVARGSVHGGDLDDWLQAERELRKTQTTSHQTKE